MSKMGFSFIYPFLMAVTIFAGSMEFITANLLVGAFDPINAFILALMVNARHLFYGLSMLEKYHGTGRKRFFLIFGMCDESFSINCTTPIPKNVDKGWFMFFVTLMNYLYWAIGAALGGILGNFITFSTEGIDFVMTALFVVIFLKMCIRDRCPFAHLPLLKFHSINFLSHHQNYLFQFLKL